MYCVSATVFTGGHFTKLNVYVSPALVAGFAYMAEYYYNDHVLYLKIFVFTNDRRSRSHRTFSFGVTHRRSLVDINMKKNISLANFTTMKTGGNARYFFCVRNVEELKEAVLFAKENQLRIFVLGSGSNTIVSDSGFDGVVIKMEIAEFQFDEHCENTIRAIAGAGIIWDEFVEKSVESNLYGVENLSCIPGTVGAAPVQNIGAYGVEVSNVIVWVDAFNIKTFKVKRFKKEECLFEYRDSFFKTKEGKEFIITHVAFDLKKSSELNIVYDGIENWFAKKNIKPSLKMLRQAVIEIRKSKLPDVVKTGNAGSFFKNPTVDIIRAKELEKKYVGLKYFPISKSSNDKKVKVSAGWLLDNVCNSKGLSAGCASVHDNHALVLINNGGSSTNDILTLAEKISDEIESKTGIILEREVNLLE